MTNAFAISFNALNTPDRVFVKIGEGRMIVYGAYGRGGWTFCSIETGREQWKNAIAEGGKALGKEDPLVAKMAVEGLAWVDRVNRSEDLRERRKSYAD